MANQEEVTPTVQVYVQEAIKAFDITNAAIEKLSAQYMPLTIEDPSDKAAVAAVDGSELPFEANAAYIVEAVNAYGELLEERERLRAALALLASPTGEEPCGACGRSGRVDSPMQQGPAFVNCPECSEVKP